MGRAGSIVGSTHGFQDADLDGHDQDRVTTAESSRTAKAVDLLVGCVFMFSLCSIMPMMVDDSGGGLVGRSLLGAENKNKPKPWRRRPSDHEPLQIVLTLLGPSRESDEAKMGEIEVKRHCRQVVGHPCWKPKLRSASMLEGRDTSTI